MSNLSPNKNQLKFPNFGLNNGLANDINEILKSSNKFYNMEIDPRLLSNDNVIIDNRLSNNSQIVNNNLANFSNKISNSNSINSILNPSLSSNVKSVMMNPSLSSTNSVMMNPSLSSTNSVMMNPSLSSTNSVMMNPSLSSTNSSDIITQLDYKIKELQLFLFNLKQLNKNLIETDNYKSYVKKIKVDFLAEIVKVIINNVEKDPKNNKILLNNFNEIIGFKYGEYDNNIKIKKLKKIILKYRFPETGNKNFTFDNDSKFIIKKFKINFLEDIINFIKSNSNITNSNNIDFYVNNIKSNNVQLKIPITIEEVMRYDKSKQNNKDFNDYLNTVTYIPLDLFNKMNNSNYPNNSLKSIVKDVIIESNINKLNQNLLNSYISSGMSSINPGMSSINPGMSSINSGMSSNLTNPEMSSINSGMSSINPGMNSNLTNPGMNSNLTNPGMNSNLTNPGMNSNLTNNNIRPKSPIKSIIPEKKNKSIKKKDKLIKKNNIKTISILSKNQKLIKK